MSRPRRNGALVLVATYLATLVIAAPGDAGIFNSPVQDCDPEPGHKTTGRWYENGQPGEINHVVTGYKHQGTDYTIDAENTGTKANGDPVDHTLTCGGPDTRWRLFLSHLGDRADTVRVDAVGLIDTSFGPIPARIEARLFGEAGADELRGHDGRDTLDGGKGEDELRSFGGKDLLVGGPSRDLMVAGGGRDLLRAIDGAPDKVRCGGGNDVAKVDRKDDVSGCETVRIG